MPLHSTWLLALLVASGDARTPTSESPTVETAVPAPLSYETVAIERELAGSGRELTRSQEAVAAVVGALGDFESWKASGIPRCRPSLWGRFVPASGLGGATFQFCNPSAPAYVWLPGQGAFMLPEAASQALHARVAALEMQPGIVSPTVVLEGISEWTLTATVADGPKRVVLSTHAEGIQLTAEQAKAVTATLAESGFFTRGKRFHTAIGEGAGPAPADSTEGTPPAAPAHPAWVELTVSVDGWKLTWQEANAASIFAHTIGSLREVALPPDASAALSNLSSTMKP